MDNRTSGFKSDFCSTCATTIASPTSILHYKSEWHVYNLKRIVASLPPISESDFLEKKHCFKAICEPVENKKTYCQVCKKSYSNSKSYNNHLNSKKHLGYALRSESKNDHQVNERFVVHSADDNPLECISDSNDFPPQALALGTCLFCDKQLTMPENGSDSAQLLADRVLAHMSDTHNFWVPYPDKLVDAAGLLRELGRIIGEERACLGCGRQFYGRAMSESSSASRQHRIALTAVRQHMLDKPDHKRVWCGTEDPVELALALAQAEANGESNGGSAALAGGELFNQFYDQSIVAPSFLLPDVDESAYEVRLPSGTVIGHRNLRSVYQQHLPPSSPSVAAAPRRLALGSAASHPLHLCGPTGQHRSLLPSAAGLTILQSRYPTRWSRIERHSEEQRLDALKKLAVCNGLRGNLVLRGHLRRQY